MSEAQSIAAKEVWARRKAGQESAAPETGDAGAPPESPLPRADRSQPSDEGVQTTTTPKDDAPAVKVSVDHSERQAALDDIRKRRAAADASDEPTHEEEPPEPTEAPAPVVEPEPVAAPATPEMVRITVDRQAFDVPKADVDAEGGIAAYQINRAAENRLKKANEILHAQAEMMARTQAALAPPAAPSKSVDELIKERVQLFQFGTPDEAATAIKEIIAASIPPALDPEKIKQEAKAETLQDMAGRAFIQRNMDILGNRTFAQLAILTENDMIATQGRPQDWNKFYADLEGKLRNDLGKPNPANQSVTTQTTTHPTSGSVADKEARKASIVALPSAAARAQAPEEPKPMTRDEKIAQLRRSRGQMP